jgi:hypothetical protein
MSYEMENLAQMVRRVGWVEGRIELRRAILDAVNSLCLSEESADSEYKDAFLAIMDVMVESTKVEDISDAKR